MYVVCQPFENRTYSSWLVEFYTKYGIPASIPSILGDDQNNTLYGV